MSYASTPLRPYSTNWRQQNGNSWRNNGTIVYRSLGARQAYELAGVSRDSAGATLGLCTLILFDTASDMPLQRVVSDGSGNFRFDNPGIGPFYIVLYLSGSPDRMGVSANTLRPTIQIQPTPPAPVLSSYSTTFAATENPISESGNWTSTDTGLTSIQTTGGNAVGVVASMSGFEDAYALKTGSWSNDQEVSATVYKAGGYAPGVNHEVECLLRGSETTGDDRTWYECLWDKDGNMSFVYLTGVASNFTDIGNDFFAGTLVPSNGDVFRCRVTGQGSSITLLAYVNNTLRLSKVVTNSAYWITGGRPGMGFFYRSGATAGSLGFSDWSCQSLS